MDDQPSGKEPIMEITQAHFRLVANVLAKLPTDDNGDVHISADALSDRFANAMAEHAPGFNRDRFLMNASARRRHTVAGGGR